MPKYYFDVVSPDDIATDTEGEDFADLDAVREEAVASARELIADALRSGDRIDGRRIQVRDESGATVLSMAILDVMR